MKNFDVYVTRNTCDYDEVLVWEDIEIGITKWHGCIEFGIEFGTANDMTKCSNEGSKDISLPTCKRRYGFIPQLGTAYNVYTKNGKIVKKRVDNKIEFSDYQAPKNGKNYTLKEIKDGCIKEVQGKDIPEKTKEKAITAIKKTTRKNIGSNSSPTIMNAFYWADTPQKHEFWAKIYGAK